jgi:hypothetical protein
MARSLHPQLRTLALGIVIVALIVGFVFRSATGNGEGAERAAQPGAQRAEQGPGFSDASADREAASSGDGNEGGASRSTPAAGATATDGEWIEVRVVRALTGEPCPLAALRIWTPEENERDPGLRIEYALEESRLEELLARGTESFVADANGRAHIPSSPVQRWAVAERKNEWGYGLIEPDAPDVGEVEVHPDFSLDVRVVDSSRSAVEGISVTTRMPDGGSYAWELHRATTDAAGRARIEHVGWHCSRSGVETGRPIEVALAEPVPDAVPFEFEQLAPPKSVIELVAPDGGTLEVRAVDAQGEVLKGRIGVEISLIRRLSDDSDDYEVEGLTVSTSGQDGTAVFRHVPLGREFLAVVNVQGSSTWYGEIGRGPTSAGASAFLDVVSEVETVLRGRALSAAGEPLGGCKVVVLTSDGRNSDFELGTTTTDIGGRFELSGVVSDDVAALVVRDSAPLGGSTAVGRVPLRFPFSTGHRSPAPIDVGDVRLQPLPLLASGRVLDENGLPVKGAEVWAQVLRRKLSERGQTTEDWERLRDSLWRSDALGRFEFRSSEASESIALYARTRDAFARPVVVKNGTSGQDLTLERAGSIHGTVVADSPLLWHSQSVMLERQGEPVPGEPPTERLRATAPDSEGRFAFRFVPAGIWTVSVRGAGANSITATVADIVVRAGERVEDPRLNPLEIQRPGVFLRCVDERGRRARTPLVWVHAPDMLPGQRDWLYPNYGDLFLPQSMLPAELWIECEGFLREHLTAVSENREVVLRPAPRVRIEFTSSEPIPKGEYRLWIWPPGSSDTDDSDDNPTAIKFERRSPSEHPVPFEGRARLELRGEFSLGDRDVIVYLPADPPSIQLDARAPVQDVKVRLDAERIRAAIEAELQRQGDPADEPDEGEDGR